MIRKIIFWITYVIINYLDQLFELINQWASYIN
jgi:hypothetical protein